MRKRKIKDGLELKQLNFDQTFADGRSDFNHGHFTVTMRPNIIVLQSADKYCVPLLVLIFYRLPTSGKFLRYTDES